MKGVEPLGKSMLRKPPQGIGESIELGHDRAVANEGPKRNEDSSGDAETNADHSEMNKKG